MTPFEALSRQNAARRAANAGVEWPEWLGPVILSAAGTVVGGLFLAVVRAW